MSQLPLLFPFTQLCQTLPCGYLRFQLSLLSQFCQVQLYYCLLGQDYLVTLLCFQQ